MNSDMKKVIKPNPLRKIKKKSGTAKTKYELLSTTHHWHVKYMPILWIVISNTCFYIILDVPDKDISIRYLNKNVPWSSFIKLKFIQIYLPATICKLLR